MQAAYATELIIAVSVCSWIHALRVLFTCFIFHFMNKSITRLILYRTGLVLFILLNLIKKLSNISLHFYPQTIFTKPGLKYVQLEHTFQNKTMFAAF